MSLIVFSDVIDIIFRLLFTLTSVGNSEEFIDSLDFSFVKRKELFGKGI